MPEAGGGDCSGKPSRIRDVPARLVRPVKYKGAILVLVYRKQSRLRLRGFWLAKHPLAAESLWPVLSELDRI